MNKICRSCKTERLASEFRQKRLSCKFCEKIYHKLYAIQNREKKLTSRRDSAKRRRHISREWAHKNLNRILIKNAARNSGKLDRTPSWLTGKDFNLINNFYVEAKIISFISGIPQHVDHIIPLLGRDVSGLHVPSNLQILPANENCRKSNNLKGWV